MTLRYAHLIMATLTTLSIASATRAAVDPYASAPAYAKPVTSGWIRTPLITTGQQVGLTGDSTGATFRFLGIPDGLGMSGIPGSGQLRLFVNHEFTQSNSVAAGPLPSGARISELVLNNLGGGLSVASARNGVVNVLAGEPPVLVTSTPTTPRFARFCSAYLGGAWSGLDTEIYFTGEETGGAATFDGKGGTAVALVNGDLFTLPRMGHANWENLVVLPGTGSLTSLVGTEDGGALTSQIYQYVGTKVAGDPDVLTRNGFRNGSLYVMVFDDSTRKNESTFIAKGTSTPIHWVAVSAAGTDANLETASQAAGSFNFVRVEDFAYDKTTPGVAYFVTTGSPGSVNPYGRLYKWTFDPAAPTGPGQLTLLLDGSEGVVSPDNIDINASGKLMICEDPNYNLSTAPLSLIRDTYLWEYDVYTKALTPVLEMDRAAARTHALAADPLNSSVAATDLPGFWEFSGVIDASAALGSNAWLLDVQAHSLRINPSTSTVEGGQILVLTRDAATPTLNSIRLNGEVTGDRRVRLRWTASNAAGIAGFRVERTEQPEAGEWIAVNQELLAASAYRFEDAPGDGDWYYRVVSFMGSRSDASESIHLPVGSPAPAGTMDVDGIAFSAPTPNPGMGAQVLRFQMPSSLRGSTIELSIFDPQGRLLKTLFHGPAAAGTQAVEWDGRDGSGQAFKGLCFARLQTPSGPRVQRIVRMN